VCASPHSVSLTVTGIDRAVVLQPAVGILLRLGFACPLEVPVSCVLITDVITTGSSSMLSSVTSSDPVNTASGNCSLVVSITRSRRLRRLSGVSGNGDTVVVTLNVGVSDDEALAALLRGRNDSASTLHAFIVSAAESQGVPLEAVSVTSSKVSFGSTSSAATDSSSAASEFATGPVVGAAAGGILSCLSCSCC